MSLNELRKEIDSLDEQMLELLNRRARLAQEVGHTKSATRSHYFTPEREHNVFKKAKMSQGIVGQNVFSHLNFKKRKSEGSCDFRSFLFSGNSKKQESDKKEVRKSQLFPSSKIK